VRDTHLLELLVVLPDTAEPPWRHDADDFVEAGPQVLDSTQSRDGHGKDDRTGPAATQDARSGSCGRPRGHTIVDDDGHPALHVERTGRRSKLSHNVLDLLRSLTNQCIQLLRPHPTG